MCRVALGIAFGRFIHRLGFQVQRKLFYRSATFCNIQHLMQRFFRLPHSPLAVDFQHEQGAHDGCSLVAVLKRVIPCQRMQQCADFFAQRRVSIRTKRAGLRALFSRQQQVYIAYLLLAILNGGILKNTPIDKDQFTVSQIAHAAWLSLWMRRYYNHPMSLSPTPIFRRVQVDDAEALITLCWPTHPLAQVRDKLLRQTRQRHACGWVIAQDAALIGYGEIARIGREIELSNLFVASAARQQGLGSVLITRLCKSAQGWDERVTLRVSTDNRAISLYTRLGFIAVENGMLDERPVWVMTRPL